MSGMQYNPGGRPPEERKQQMEKKFVGPSLLIVTVMGCLLLTRDARTAPSYPQAPTPVSESYVQVTSVTIEPSTIHRTQNPNTVTVIAQILLGGQAPPNPEAIIEVGTSSSDPPNDELKYEKPTRTVSLEKGVTVVRFKAETTSKSFQGKIKVAVTLGGATRGINIKDSEPKDYIAELTVVDP
jgi:hypothetical protein